MLAFAVVVIGGLGSVAGALVGRAARGPCPRGGGAPVPQVELFVIYGVMALVLAVRPEGLFARVPRHARSRGECLARLDRSTTLLLVVAAVLLVVVGPFLPTWLPSRHRVDRQGARRGRPAAS